MLFYAQSSPFLLVFSLNLPFWYITLYIYVYKYGVELLTGISTDIT